MVPIIHVFAEDDQLRVRNGLCSIQFLEKGIRRRTAGTTFRSEKLDENGVTTRVRSFSNRRFMFYFLRGPIGGRRRLQK